MRKIDIGVSVTLLLAIVGFAYWCGQLQTKVSLLNPDEINKAREGVIKEIQNAGDEAKKDVQGATDIKVTNTASMNRGTTVITIDKLKGGVLVAFRVEASSYDSRCLLFVFHDGRGNPGYCQVLAHRLEFDPSHYGEPGFTVDKDGKLLVSNPKYPTDGVTAHYSVLRISDE